MRTHHCHFEEFLQRRNHHGFKYGGFLFAHEPFKEWRNLKVAATMLLRGMTKQGNDKHWE